MNNILKPKQLLTISLLSMFLSSVAIAAPAKKPFGLGLPVSSGTVGAVRGNSLLIPLVPEDGGRTASEKPTFYWYLPDSNNFPYKTIFEIRDPSDRDGTVIYKSEGIADKSGLYKLSLPANSSVLKREKVYVWQLRMRGSKASSDLQAAGSILLSKIDNDLQKAIAQAPTSLEKAKIYGSYGYWFDALNIYTSQIELEPQNQTAYKMRSEMLQEIFTPKSADPEAIANVKNLVDKINKSTVNELSLPRVSSNPEI
jgi:hypothetical protein